MRNSLVAKLKESLASVLPLTLLVIAVHFALELFAGGGLPFGMLLQFIIGAIMLIVGMTFFAIGADVAMIPMGDRIGAHLSKTNKYYFLIPVCFVIGTLVTIAEPDLSVLAEQFPIDNWTLIITVAAGVGAFLVIAVLRVLRRISLSLMLIGFYALVFAIAAFTPGKFLAVAFDSGGVTTGPITVPFIMAIGIGLATVRGGKSSTDDSFGTVALCSIGPILAMLILGILTGDSADIQVEALAPYHAAGADIPLDFLRRLPDYMGEVAMALLPIVAMFAAFQMLFLRLRAKMLLRLGIGIVYTYIGLTVFLTGVNVGFLPAGDFLGSTIASLPAAWILIPMGMLMGFFVVMAEPAVRVLNQQVEELTVGAVTKKAMLLMLSIGVATSIGIAMLRVLTGISLWYFLIGGYAISLGLSFIVPKVFTAIAFDSGGVASGAMTATFLLPFAQGACAALHSNASPAELTNFILNDAFGLVALVAMTPLITIQLLGLSYTIKLKRADALAAITDDSVTIIEFDLKEVAC